jgi:hypothetical protein
MPGHYRLMLVLTFVLAVVAVAVFVAMAVLFVAIRRFRSRPGDEAYRLYRTAVERVLARQKRPSKACWYFVLSLAAHPDGGPGMACRLIRECGLTERCGLAGRTEEKWRQCLRRRRSTMAVGAAISTACWLALVAVGIYSAVESLHAGRHEPASLLVLCYALLAAPLMALRASVPLGLTLIALSREKTPRR